MAFLAAGMVLISGGAWAVALVGDPEPFEAGAAALLAVSMIIGAATAALGMVLARGRWARWLAMGVLAGEGIVAGVLGLSGWVTPALGVTAAAVVLVAGPWLDGFLRQLPVADPLPISAMTLALGLLFLPAVASISAPGGVSPAHWIAGLAGVLVAWAFARALTPGLWAARIVVPILLIAAAFASPPAGAALLVAVAVGVGVLAWMPSTALAVNPLVPQAAGVAVPPELVPAELLKRAGYDERGRPSKQP